MNDKPFIPFSADEIKNLLDIDTGMKCFLESMSDGDKHYVEELINSESLRESLFSLLPEDLKNQAREFVDTLYSTPQKALNLYQECRFFEARSLILESIRLYEYEQSPSLGCVDGATAFVAKRVQALFYDLLAEIEAVLGNTEQAGKYHYTALELAEAVGDIDTRIKALQGLGVYFWERGDGDSAYDYCSQALALTENHPDRWQSRQKILTTLSIISSKLRDSDECLEFAMQAVDLCLKQQDERSLPVCLSNLATLFMDSYGLQDAIETLEFAADVTEEAQYLRAHALILNNLAFCYLHGEGSDEQLDKAHCCILKALNIAREIGSRKLESLSRGNMARLQQRWGKRDEAERSFQKSAEIYRQLNMPEEEATALVNLAKHYKDDGHLTSACEACGKAIEIFESLRKGLRRELHRINYTNQVTEPYALIVDCLLKLNRLSEAVSYVERAKSRSLVEFLALTLTEDTPLFVESEHLQKVITFLREIDEIRRNLEAIEQRENDDADSPDVRSFGLCSTNLVENLRESLAEKTKDFDKAYADLIRYEPEKAGLVKSLSVSLEEIELCLDEKTLLIELYQTEQALQIFMISRSAPVEIATVEISEYEGLGLVWNIIDGINETAQVNLQSHDYLRKVRQPLSAIYERLFRPLMPRILLHQRIIIAPHLFWHFFPFHALFDIQEKKYLCDQLEIGYVPSASVLSLCVKKEKLERKSALIMARGGGDLPYAEKEARTLAKSFFPDVRICIDDKANLGEMKQRNSSWDVMHLACHGMYCQDQPFLSGIDIPPDAMETRSTYLLDLFGMKMDCTQVTISACESGMSSRNGADEPIGLSRGLFYAGAASVMLSLWKVADESACFFMEYFYQHFVDSGKTKTRAVQLAMQAVKEQPQYAHPYYWAPFVQMGDWR